MTLGTSEDVLKRKDLLAPPTLAPMPLWRLREVQRVKASLKYAYNQLPTRWRADHWLSFNASAWTLWKKRKLFTPQTAKIVSKWKGDAQNYWKVLARIQEQERSRKPTKKAAVQTLRSLVSPEFYTLLEGQVLLQGRKKKGRRWPEELKEYALSPYFYGPKAYRFLSKVLALPTSRSLQKGLSE
ncbi:hypothetical protein HPB47_018790, partial [Ixodes persulcatus]